MADIVTSISAGTTPAPALIAHDKLSLLHLGFGHSADARILVVGVLGIDALQTA